MRKSVCYVAAALACTVMDAGSARAQSAAFGAGTSVSTLTYRQLMDCLYDHAIGSPGKPPGIPKAANCTAFNASGFGGLMLFTPTTSANGKLVLRTNSVATIIMPSISNVIPYTDSTIGVNDSTNYDGVQFAISDDVVNAADMAAWNAAGNPARYGNLIQIPAFIATVGIGFNGRDGNGAPLNIATPTPAGGTSGLNLSRTALCGIVSGHVTKWNNFALAVTNGGVVLGNGNITFVHNKDSAGTTLLFSNAMVEQCRYEFGPANENDPSIVSYAYPWTDRFASCTAPRLPVGADLVNWPDQFPTDQCGNAIATPADAHFANASGNSGVTATIASLNGAIGYAAVDALAPMNLNGPRTANLQSQWDLNASTGQFQPPTWQGAQIAMSLPIPSFPTSDERTNPLQWSMQGVIANPIRKGAYPIAGFSWIEMYQCYAVHANGNNGFIWFRTWLDYLYGSSDAHDMMHYNGLAEVPGSWTNEIYTLLSDPAFGPNQAGNGGCSTIAGAY